jgi:hypothetical protein
MMVVFVSYNLYFNKSFSVGPTLFIGFLVVHILLVEFPNKRENVLFFVGFNCCLLGLLTIYLSIEESLQIRDHASFNFSKPFQIMIEFFFFLQTNLFLGALFHWVETVSAYDQFFFFFFQTNLFLGHYPTEKNRFRL